MATRDPIDVESGRMREALSRMLLPVATQAPRYRVPAPASLLDQDPGSDVAVSHGTSGWGDAKIDRRHMEVESLIYDPWSKAFEMDCIDVRGAVLRRAWDPGRTRNGGGVTQQGRARILPSTAFLFRATKAWERDFDGGFIQTRLPHEPKIGSKGVLIERKATNSVFNSSNAGLAGWSGAGGGINGSAITAAADALMFDPSITPNVWKITAGSPHTADLYMFEVCPDVLTNGNKYCWSFDHFDPSGVAPSYELLLNGQFWNAGTGAFQAGAVWNAMTLSRWGYARHKAAFTANFAGTPIIRVGLPNATTAGAIVFVAHVQQDMGDGGASHPWASSRIITPAAANYYRSGDVNFFANTYPNVLFSTQGTHLFTLYPMWNTTDGMGSLELECFQVKYDANNSVRAWVDGATKTVKFRIRESGVNTDITSSAITVADGARLTVALRHCSSENELGSTYGTPAGGKNWFDMIVNGTRVNAGQSAKPTVITASNAVVGGEENGEIDAWVSATHTPYVLSESECGKWMEA